MGSRGYSSLGSTESIMIFEGIIKTTALVYYEMQDRGM